MHDINCIFFFASICTQIKTGFHKTWGKHNQTPEGTVGPVERKLMELGEVQGIVSGNFGEVSEATHTLVAALARCRFEGGRGDERQEGTHEV